jgi:hypothetical protein
MLVVERDKGRPEQSPLALREQPFNVQARGAEGTQNSGAGGRSARYRIGSLGARHSALGTRR